MQLAVRRLLPAFGAEERFSRAGVIRATLLAHIDHTVCGMLLTVCRREAVLNVEEGYPHAGAM